MNWKPSFPHTDIPWHYCCNLTRSLLGNTCLPVKPKWRSEQAQRTTDFKQNYAWKLARAEFITNRTCNPCQFEVSTLFEVHKEGLQQRGLQKTWIHGCYNDLGCRPHLGNLDFGLKREFSVSEACRVSLGLRNYHRDFDSSPALQEVVASVPV